LNSGKPLPQRHRLQDKAVLVDDSLPVVVREGIVILHGGKVARPLDVAANQVSNACLVEGATAPREHARVVDQIIDHRVGVRPVGLGG
jgi:hypothetical protein